MASEHNLRDRRAALGWTQAQLAEAAGLNSQSYVGMVERGRAPAGATKRVEEALTIEERIRACAAAEQAGIAERRRLAAALPDSPEWRALQQALGERAINLLNIGQAEACDALLGLLPESEADRLLNEWMDAQFPDPTPHKDSPDA